MRSPRRGSVFPMIFGAVALATVCSPVVALAQEGQVGAYDLSSMPLGLALERLGQRSGLHVNYDEWLAEGIASRPVVNAASPRDALHQMLEGTGLTARFTGPDAFTIVRRSTEARPDLRLDDLLASAPAIGRPSASDYSWYGGLLLEECFRRIRTQASLKGAKYDIQLYVWLDSSGAVVRMQSVGPLEQSHIRRQIEDLLGGLRLASLPPQAMPQPIRLRIAAL
jgi:hypothetical protein